MDLTKKVVVVAGASGVMGGTIARLLDERGAKLVLAGRDEARLRELASKFTTAETVRFDIRSPGSAALPLEAAVDGYGRVDGLVNAAGVVGFGPIGSHPEEVIDDIISTNLLGPLHMMAAAARHMDGGGFIANITGVVAEEPFPGMAAYVAAKAGLSAATLALARELRRNGILVVDARPPHTETGLADRSIFGDAPPFPQGLQPEHVARIIVEGIESDRREIPAARFNDR
jgi:cyclic-di-GMP-binding biofilm dispersal mediator protein